VLNLLTWIINYGANNGLCEGISFHIKKPTVDNTKTEYLTSEQLKSLLDAISNDSNIEVSDLVKLALFTGMRKGELLNLQWKDLDFDRGFITLRDTKGGKDQTIPMNENARNFLQSHSRSKSKYVFPGRNGGKRATVDVAANKIKKQAGLPKDFRPLHGLRHAYASMLVSSGKVDLYTLQKLLTHKDPRMTQRYAHLRDEALKRAANVADNIIGEAAKEVKEEDNKKIVSLEGQV
jgi:integrase